MPSGQLKQRVADVQTQIKNVQENYSSQDEGHFKTPESDRQAIQMLQLVKMRAVLRVEHNKGKIDPQGFAQEDRRLELMQLKINIANLVKRAMDAQIQGQFGTCRQLYTKGLSALASVTDKDPYLMAREEDMRQGLAGLDAHLQEHSEKELQSIKDKEADELDVLFQPKKNGDYVALTDTTLGPMAPFVCQLLTELEALAIHPAAIEVDHPCYRAATLPEYQALKALLASHGDLLVEG